VTALGTRLEIEREVCFVHLCVVNARAANRAIGATLHAHGTSVLCAVLLRQFVELRHECQRTFGNGGDNQALDFQSRAQRDAEGAGGGITERGGRTKA
jgi:hypothetical protein